MASFAGSSERRAGRLAVLALVLGSLAGAATVSAASVREYEVKAAMLLNLAKFVKWPDDAFAQPDAPLTVCVLGSDPFGKALSKLKGREVQGHPVASYRYPDASAAQVSARVPCHIVFVSRSLSATLDATLGAFAGKPSLTVGDMRGFAERGGMINLVLVDNKVRFRINPSRATAVGLSINARLLQLATIVKQR